MTPSFALRVWVYFPTALKSFIFFVFIGKISVTVNLNMWKEKNMWTIPLITEPHFQPHFFKSKPKSSREGSSLAYPRVEPIQHWKGENKPRMLHSYSSPQHFELGQNYACFTNEAAGTREMKESFGGPMSRLGYSLMRIAALPCPAFWLHRAEVRCRGPASTLWLTCSQRPNLTLWYPSDRVPGAWLALRVYLLNGCVVTAKEFIIVIHLILAISVLGRCWMCFEIPLRGNWERIRAGEMAQQSKALAATPEFWVWSPETTW